MPKISLAPSDTNLPFILKRRQFRLRLAFAMTINKAQGQTFAREIGWWKFKDSDRHQNGDICQRVIILQTSHLEEHFGFNYKSHLCDGMRPPGCLRMNQTGHEYLDLLGSIPERGSCNSRS
ncbi:hypothetical protein LAZ67_9001761 [Cordylochernes scorpioides]|uniref:Uncharacterized protein n=1 Tax=Cordylochernes scorpioides TaxID=51811 RepID=A0ABY6KWY5_9ARAC|nr:hypothetical protein LAZ67_9001761 [Cordylochernes scorpioides]